MTNQHSAAYRILQKANLDLEFVLVLRKIGVDYEDLRDIHVSALEKRKRALVELGGSEEE